MTRREWTRAIPKAHRALMLRTCAADGTSHGGFVWPAKGYVEARDWNPGPVCGGGLHGALRGEGDGSLFRRDADALWRVVEVDGREVVDLEGKVKVPRGWVVYTGDRLTATAMVAAAYPAAAVIGCTATAGDYGTATAGDYGTATAGGCGTATAGNRGTATAGGHGTATAGNRGTATAGGCGTATAGNLGTATAGYLGTATAWYRGTASAGGHGTATAGNRGAASAGDCGTATAGCLGTATAGVEGTATAGVEGEIRIRWWDAAASRYRCAVGYIGEGGLQPNTPYRYDAREQRFVDAQ